jgi:hypothetical protein
MSFLSIIYIFLQPFIKNFLFFFYRKMNFLRNTVVLDPFFLITTSCPWSSTTSCLWVLNSRYGSSFPWQWVINDEIDAIQILFSFSVLHGFFLLIFEIWINNITLLEILIPISFVEDNNIFMNVSYIKLYGIVFYFLFSNFIFYLFIGYFKIIDLYKK